MNALVVDDGWTAKRVTEALFIDAETAQASAALPGGWPYCGQAPGLCGTRAGVNGGAGRSATRSGLGVGIVNGNAWFRMERSLRLS